MKFSWSDGRYLCVDFGTVIIQFHLVNGLKIYGREFLSDEQVITVEDKMMTVESL